MTIDFHVIYFSSSIVCAICDWLATNTQIVSLDPPLISRSFYWVSHARSDRLLRSQPSHKQLIK